MAVSLTSSIPSSGKLKLISEIPTTEKYSHNWSEPKCMQRSKKSRQKSGKSNYDKLSLFPEDLTEVTEEEFGLDFECFGQYYCPDTEVVSDPLAIVRH